MINMKRISLIICAILLCFLSSCNHSEENNRTDAVVFIDTNKDYAYVICGIENKCFKDVRNYKFNGKEWDDYIFGAEQEVNTNLLKTGDKFDLYNSIGEKKLLNATE